MAFTGGIRYGAIDRVMGIRFLAYFSLTRSKLMTDIPQVQDHEARNSTKRYLFVNIRDPVRMARPTLPARSTFMTAIFGSSRKPTTPCVILLLPR